MDRNIPETFATRDKENNQLVVFQCPYCRKEHRHGAGKNSEPGSADGHRMSHCANGEDSDGIGYYVIEMWKAED